MLKTDKRIVIFAGHYGSGKTNLAVNYALEMRKAQEKVILCDMDTVNPYFRTKDSEDLLEEHGVTLISPEYANTNVDLPSLPATVNQIFSQKDAKVIVDVGGDDSGAVVLGQYAKRLEEAGYEMLLVINKYRYLTRKAIEIQEMKEEIEAASRLHFTGIINNSNLGKETTAETIEDSYAYAEEAGKLTGLPVKTISHRRGIEVKGKDTWEIEIYTKQAWQIF